MSTDNPTPPASAARGTAGLHRYVTGTISAIPGYPHHVVSLGNFMVAQCFDPVTAERICRFLNSEQTHPPAAVPGVEEAVANVMKLVRGVTKWREDRELRESEIRAAVAQLAQRPLEQVVAWAIRNSLATGHADTLADLFASLDLALAEMRADSARLRAELEDRTADRDSWAQQAEMAQETAVVAIKDRDAARAELTKAEARLHRIEVYERASGQTVERCCCTRSAADRARHFASVTGLPHDIRDAALPPVTP